MKILKLFISLSLILSVSLINSIAAISVSDGSAFVTKAEFAADLNNLSNRMSSLENSLDAKIDSLVSSYLSRNGIWNGEKQTFLDYTEKKIWPNKWATKKTGDETVTNDPIEMSNITKAGLANFKAEIYGANQYGTDKVAGTIYFLISNYTVANYAAKAIITFKYQVLNKVGDSYKVIFDKPFYSTIYNSVVTQNKVMAGFLPSYSCNDFFFVEKDMNLCFRLVVISEGGNFDTPYFLKDIDTISYVTPVLQYTSLDIY